MTLTPVARRTAILACCALAGVTLAACSPEKEPGNLSLRDAGEPGAATVTLLMDGDRRPRSVGNIIARNSGALDVAVTDVSLRDAENVRVSEAFLVPAPAADSGGLGVGYPMPPQEGDPQYDVHAELWDQRQPINEATVSSGREVAVVPLVELVDPGACGRFTGVDIDVGTGRAAWTTTYVIVPEAVQESDCT